MDHPDIATHEKTEDSKRGERREQLREFQSQLLERMEDARARSPVSTNQLGIIIGQTHYLLNLREAGEIVSVGQITPVPLTREWYLGLFNIRGSLVGVIDLQRYRDQAAVEINPDCRIIAFSPQLAFNAGLLVNKVLGLRNVAAMNAQEAGSAESTEKKPWLLQTYVDANQQVWHEISLAQLIKEHDFLHIGLYAH